MDCETRLGQISGRSGSAAALRSRVEVSRIRHCRSPRPEMYRLLGDVAPADLQRTVRRQAHNLRFLPANSLLRSFEGSSCRTESRQNISAQSASENRCEL